MDHERLVEAVQAKLDDKAVPADQAWAAGCDLLARGLAADSIEPGDSFQVVREVKDDAGRVTEKVYGTVWGLSKQAGKDGYFGVFSSAGGLRLYRIIAHDQDGPLAWDEDKKEWKGGNAYVLIDKYKSPVVN